MKIIDTGTDTATALDNLFENFDKKKIHAFRGQSDYGNTLIPGIYRGLDKLVPPIDRANDSMWIGEIERDVHRDFVTNGIAVHKMHERWETLFFGQHHGLPTRLLDWTTEFFVAMYFAVENLDARDGHLWCVNVSDFPHPKELGRLSSNGGYRLEALLTCVETDNLSFFTPQSKSMVSASSRANSAIPCDQSRDSTRTGFMAFLLPPKTDQRMKNQKALFSIYLSYNDYDFVLDHAEYIQHLETVYSQELLTKIVIPAASKPKIKQYLIDRGKDPFSIYPDLPGLVSQLKEQRLQSLKFWEDERK